MRHGVLIPMEVGNTTDGGSRDLASSDKGKRVLMVHLLFSSRAGSGHAAMTLSKALAECGMTVTVATTTRASLPVEPIPGLEAVPVPVEGARNRVGWIVRTAARLAALMVRRRHAYDVLHAHGPSPEVLGLFVLARLLRKPCVLKMTMVDGDDPVYLRRRWRTRISYLSYLLADAVISISPALSARYQESGVAQSRLVEIPNAVDTRRFRPATVQERAALRERLSLPADGYVATFVGYPFSPRKGCDFLMRAWQTFQREHPAARLVLVGDTTYEDAPGYASSLTDLVDELGLGKCVLFVGATARPEDYLRASDAFVFTSTSEGLPNAVLEALACALPCVVRRIPGITDWLITDGVDGFLAPVEDPQAFGLLLCRLAEDGLLAARLGAAARRMVMQRFSGDSVARQYLELYARLCGVRSGRSGPDCGKVEEP